MRVTRRGKRFPTGYEMAGRTGRREERSEVRSHLSPQVLVEPVGQVERSLPISNQKWPFPFLTMRSQVTLHALSRAIRASDCQRHELVLVAVNDERAASLQAQWRGEQAVPISRRRSGVTATSFADFGSSSRNGNMTVGSKPGGGAGLERPEVGGREQAGHRGDLRRLAIDRIRRVGVARLARNPSSGRDGRPRSRPRCRGGPVRSRTTWR